MKYVVTLNDRTYEVEVEHGEAMIVDEYEAKAPVAAVAAAPVAAAPVAVAAPVPSQAAAPAAAVAVAGEQVKAPLPGNVLKLIANVGDDVKAGDVLLIIEAMKMENEIAAPCDGTVKQILVSKGQLVATGDLLVVL